MNDFDLLGAADDALVSAEVLNLLRLDENRLQVLLLRYRMFALVSNTRANRVK